ncbi:MAG: hypothetical protein WBB67_09685 [bacterium]
MEKIFGFSPEESREALKKKLEKHLPQSCLGPVGISASPVRL